MDLHTVLLWCSVILNKLGESVIKKSVYVVFNDVIFPNSVIYDGEVELSSSHEQYEKWPEINGAPTVHYEILIENKKRKQMIEDAMKHVEERTCVKFVPIDRHHNTSHGKIRISNHENCFSYIGKLGYSQNVAVSPQCGIGEVIHEVCHVLGMVHEQTRPDRDDDIYVFPENVNEDMILNFKKLQCKGYIGHNKPYDLTSVMHYQPNFITAYPFKLSMVTKDPKLQFLMGLNRIELSYLDKYFINKHYKCIDKWINNCNLTNSLMRCQNHGYISSNCSCICPPGTSGEYCSEILKSDYPNYYYDYIPKCRETIKSNKLIKIESGKHGYLPANTFCTYNVEAPADHEIVITFIHFNIYSPGHSRCIFDYFIIRSTEAFYKLMCGFQVPGIFVSSSNISMTLLLRSQAKIMTGNSFEITSRSRLFEISVKIRPRRGIIKGTMFYSDIHSGSFKTSHFMFKMWIAILLMQSVNYNYL